MLAHAPIHGHASGQPTKRVGLLPTLPLQVRENFQRFSGQELACIAWALRRFGYSAEHNAVFYMLQRQVGCACMAVLWGSGVWGLRTGRADLT